MPEDKGRRTGLAIRYIEEGDGDPRHGTNNGYQNLRCRCRPCTDAFAAYTLVKHHARRGSLAPGDSRHGTYNGYRNYGCRCVDCKAASAAYARDYYSRQRAAG